MNTIKVNNKNVLMIAHRGLSGLEPENTIPAFIAAGNRNYYGIETDIHVTKDGKIIVTHDNHTGRVAVDNVVVEEITYDLARKIRLRNICRIERNNGVDAETVPVRDDLMFPNLKEYVNICKKYEKKCVLELKNRFEPEDIKTVIKEIEECQYLENVIFISFKFDNMVNLREMLPEQELQYLIEEEDPELIEKLNKYNLELDIDHTMLTKELVDEVHANGHKVNCWTVDNPETAEKLVAWGVDFITTNMLEGVN